MTERINAVLMAHYDHTGRNFPRASTLWLSDADALAFFREGMQGRIINPLLPPPLMSEEDREHFEYWERKQRMNDDEIRASYAGRDGRGLIYYTSPYGAQFLVRIMPDLPDGCVLPETPERTP